MKRNFYHRKDEELSVKKKKKYEKVRDIWLADPLFKSWIKKMRNLDGDFQLMCAVCNGELSCARTTRADPEELRLQFMKSL